MPEANDEFAKSVSRFQTIAELRSSIGEFLKMQKEEKERQRFRLLLLEQIDSQSTIELGPEAIEAEIQTMMQELKASVSTMGLRWEQYLAQIKETEGSLRLKIKGEAERRLRYALLLHAIAKAENIEPSREEVTKEANKFLRQFSSPREAESQIDMTTLLDYSKNALRNEKVFQLLETYAT
jgi:trigger factor